MPGVYFHSDGTPTQHPTSRESAIKQRKKRYDDGHKCPDCLARGHNCPIKYTANGRCVHCARLTAIELYNQAVTGRADEHMVATLPAALIEEAERGFHADPAAAVAGSHCKTADEAERVGAPVWIRLEACPRAGHPGVRTIDDRCWYCVQERAAGSARQQAIAAGRAWYTPEEPCPHCGERAQRRVHDGRCAGCHEAGREARTADMHTLPPDIVIGRADARAAGFTVYRTGRPCRRGHTGFRYVSTGNCIQCLRGE